MKIIVPFRNPCLAVTVEATRHTAGHTPHGMHSRLGVNLENCIAHMQAWYNVARQVFWQGSAP